MEKKRSEQPSRISLFLHELQTELSTMDIEAVMVLDYLKNPIENNLQEAELSTHAIRAKIREISTSIRVHLYQSGERTTSNVRETEFSPVDFFKELVQRWNRDPKADITLQIRGEDERRVQERGVQQSGMQEGVPQQSEEQVSQASQSMPFSTNTIKLLVDVLLSNAVRFRKGEVARITLNVQADPDQLTILCHDEGIGIPSHEIEQIGQLFFRATNAEGTDGNGVALHFAISLLREFGGDLKIRSKEGEFTEVEIVIPAGRR